MKCKLWIESDTALHRIDHDIAEDILELRPGGVTKLVKFARAEDIDSIVEGEQDSYGRKSLLTVDDFIPYIIARTLLKSFVICIERRNFGQVRKVILFDGLLGALLCNNWLKTVKPKRFLDPFFEVFPQVLKKLIDLLFFPTITPLVIRDEEMFLHQLWNRQ